MIGAVAVALIICHTAIALTMGWLALTQPRTNPGLVLAWFTLSIATAITLGFLAR
jgi:hypothetical protein